MTDKKHNDQKQTHLKRIHPNQTRLEQAHPEQSHLQQANPEQTRSEQAQPKQTDPEQSHLQQAQPEHTPPKQTHPKQTRPKKIHPGDAYVGAQLRRAREYMGITQQALAKLVHTPITHQQIQRYENGTNPMPVSQFWEFCLALNLPPDMFFPEDGHGTVQCVNAQEVRFLNLFRTLPNDKKQAIMQLL